MNQNQHSQYNVFNTLRSENQSFQNKFQNKSKKSYFQNSTENNYHQNGSPNHQNNGYKNFSGQHKNQQDIQPGQNRYQQNVQSNQGRYSQDNKSNQNKMENRPMSINDRIKLVGPKHRNSCLFCLEPFHRPCPHYQRTPLTNELCVRFNESGRKILCGFHLRSVCKHRKQKVKPGSPIIWGPKKN